jgi:hypothetical protein
MAKTKTVRVSDEELIALQAWRETQKAGQPVEETPKERVATEAQKALADAFVSAIERTRPPEKKNPFNRKVKTPWFETGQERVKMKRKFYQHGMLIGDRVNNVDIELLNQLKPGRYCDGIVKVTLRKDRGIDISYPMNTAAQRLKLVNMYKIGSFTDLLRRVIDERNNPTKYRKPEDLDLYDLDE